MTCVAMTLGYRYVKNRQPVLSHSQPGQVRGDCAWRVLYFINIQNIIYGPIHFPRDWTLVLITCIFDTLPTKPPMVWYCYIYTYHDNMPVSKYTGLEHQLSASPIYTVLSSHHDTYTQWNLSSRDTDERTPSDQGIFSRNRVLSTPC